MLLSSSFLWNLVLQAAVLPFAVTLILLLCAQCAGVRWRPYSALALAAGFLTAYFVVYTQFVFPPIQALDWLPLLLLAALIAVALRNGALLPQRFAWLLPTMLVIAALAALLWPILKAGEGRFLFEAGVAGVVWLALWHYLERESCDAMAVGLGMVVVAVGNAVIAAAIGSILTGQLCGVLAAATGGWLLWRVRRPQPLPVHGVAAPALLLLGSLMIVGRFYADIAATPMLLSLAGFVAVVLFPWVSGRYNRYAALTLTAVAALVPVGLSVLLALTYYADASDGY